MPLLSGWPVIFCLILNELVSALSAVKWAIVPLSAKTGSSLRHCHNILDVFQYLTLYSFKLYIGITILISWASSTCVMFILLMHLVNGAQFSSIIFLLVPLFSCPWAAVFATVVVPSRSIYALL